MTATEETRAVDLVLWDFGGIFTGSPFANLADYAESLDTTREVLIDLTMGYDQPDGDHPWHRLERGELALTDAVDAIAARAAAAGLDGFDSGRFFTSLGSVAGDARPQVVELVRRLGQVGLRQGLVTNNIAEFSGRWQQLVPIELFEHVVDSSAVGCRKPDPRIFRIALDRFGDPPAARVAFLDDHEVNAAAAAMLGLRAVLVPPDPAPALAELGRLCGL